MRGSLGSRFVVVFAAMQSATVFAQVGVDASAQADGAAQADGSAQVQVDVNVDGQVPVVEHPSAAADACVPSCRSGYVCLRGACVSACNPVCGANEQCTATGECIPTAPTSVQVQPVYNVRPPPDPQAAFERDVLRERRHRLRLGIFVDLGAAFFEAPGGSFGSLDTVGPLGEFGFELRKNFAYRVGVRFRTGVAVSGGQDESEDTGLWLLRIFASPSFRIGPFAQGFPFYIDLGAHIGVRMVGSSAAEDGPVGEGGGSSSSVDAQFSAGPETGLGFVFGEERFDIALRGNSGFGGDEFQFWSAKLSFGMSFR